MGTSIRPPLDILPARANTFVPVLLLVPISLKASAPLLMIHGIRESVSTLLTSVGLPLKPFTAG
jgi:hypothetical protein